MSNEQMWNHFPFPRIEAFTKWKKAKKFYRQLTGKDLKPMKGKSSEIHYLECASAQDVAIIYFDMNKLRNTSQATRSAIVAHECSHLVDDYMKSIGEDEVGTEFRAYCLDSAVLSVLAQLGEEWLTAPKEGE